MVITNESHISELLESEDFLVFLFVQIGRDHILTSALRGYSLNSFCHFFDDRDGTRKERFLHCSRNVIANNCGYLVR